MISRVEALNYRSLRYVSQPLQPFKVLVGPNASGKSTFLDVIALLSDFVVNGLDECLLFNGRDGHGRARHFDELIFNQSTDYFELAIEFAVPVHLREGNGSAKDHLQYDTARYEVSFGKTEKGEIEIRAETLWLIDSQRNTQQSKQKSHQLSFPIEPNAPETLITKGRARDGWRKVVNKIGKSGNDYFQDEHGQWNLMVKLGPRKAALSGLFEDPARFPVSMWVRDQLRDGIRVLSLNSAAMRKPVSPSALRRFSVDGANLPIVIQDLKNENPDDYQNWLAHLKTILVDLKDIHVVERPEDRHLYLALNYRNLNESVPSWLVSDGTLRLMALTLLAYLPNEMGTYLIEEPENGVHPKAIEGVFQSLSSVYQGQVLIATHSPLLLGLTEPAQLLCFAKNPSGAVDVISGEQHPLLRKWRREIDLSTLYASGVLG